MSVKEKFTQKSCNLRKGQLADVVPSSAAHWHAATVVFARKADGTWRFCQDYRGHNAITQRSMDPLPYVDQLVDETRSARFFTKLDLAMAYMQFRICEDDQFKTSLRVTRRAVRVARRHLRSALYVVGPHALYAFHLRSLRPVV